MLTIWGRASAMNVQKVVWAADECGRSYRRIDAGTVFGVVATPEYRKMNPNGTVPTIDDDGVVLWESNVIVRYLCARYGKNDIYPADIVRRMEAERWMDWQLAELSWVYRPAVRVFGRDSPDPSMRAQAEESFEKTNAILAILDRRLADNAYVSGEHFSMGDIPLGVLIHQWLQLNRPITGLDNVKRWYELLRKRPGAAWAMSVSVRRSPPESNL